MLTTQAFEIDRTKNTITLARRIKATPARLYEAWTTPEQVALWWDPAGTPLADCEIDLRVGGKLRFVNAGSGHPFDGTFRVIEPPNRLVFDSMGTRGELTFVADGTRTLMTLVMTCGSAEHLEQFLKMGIADGTARTLDNLVAYINGGA
jgi:uncharacterized protein YndB with AHSA1/START domain